MAQDTAWTESTVDIAGSKMHLRRGGKGSPVLVLHHDIGTLDRLPFYDTLARSHDVLVPDHPGYGKSERPEWMRSARDVAVMYQSLLAKLGIGKARLIGLGFGGWIAAEMATMSPASFDRLVLVGAMGLKPPQGDILDQAIQSYIGYAAAGFHDPQAFKRVYGEEPTTDQLVQWDVCREMNFRIAWKPYMYSQTLPHLLSGVQASSLVVWGAEDKVVPISAGQLYARLLPGARFESVAACGHCVEMEKPDELARHVSSFIA